MLRLFVMGNKILTRRGCKNYSSEHRVINLRNEMILRLPLHAYSSRSTKIMYASFASPQSPSKHYQTRKVRATQILSSCSSFTLLTLSTLRRAKARAMTSTISLSIFFSNDHQKFRKFGLSLYPSISILAAETLSSCSQSCKKG